MVVVSFGQRTFDTIVYQVAKYYYKKNIRESAFDPVFVLAAMIDWAAISSNERGVIRLLHQCLLMLFIPGICLEEINPYLQCYPVDKLSASQLGFALVCYVVECYNVQVKNKEDFV